MQSNSSRRRFLAVGSAATVFASLHGAIAQAEDPVFAALAAYECAKMVADAANDDALEWRAAARMESFFAKAGDVFRSEPTTRPGALALLHFLGGEVGSAFAAWRQEAPGAILRALAVLDA